MNGLYENCHDFDWEVINYQVLKNQENFQLV